mmetsp:Transcript_29226/g.38976  ORF Transcript_29226/g.38976 Transcript_29226/m.38976 type:complete len:122 (+) Transcript_29226:127-492(+)
MLKINVLHDCLAGNRYQINIKINKIQYIPQKADDAEHNANDQTYAETIRSHAETKRRLFLSLPPPLPMKTDCRCFLCLFLDAFWLSSFASNDCFSFLLRLLPSQSGAAAEEAATTVRRRLS